MGNINIKDELKRMRIPFKYDSHMRDDWKECFISGLDKYLMIFEADCDDITTEKS